MVRSSEEVWGEEADERLREREGRREGEDRLGNDCSDGLIAVGIELSRSA
jgi:hypothetical protein